MTAGNALTDGLFVSVSGVRGVVGRGLTPDSVVRWTAAFAKLTGNGKIVVGRDSRQSGYYLMGLVTSTLAACGCEVLNIGLATTPTTEHMVRGMSTDGGIVITASHNPPEWNALKFIGPGGMFLGAEDIASLKLMVAEGLADWADLERLGEIHYSDEADRYHVDEILSLEEINLSRIRSHGFKVAIDANAGVGGKIGLLLMAELNVDVVPIKCTPNGDFAHGLEPIPEHLADLSETVLERECDLGFALDPDGDRLALVDEKGRIPGEEYTLPLALDLLLARKKGPIVINSSTSAMSELIAAKYGVSCHRAAVGEINVTRKIDEIHAIAGGEGNGGIIYPRCHPCRDGILGMALILEGLASRGGNLSEWLEEMPRLTMIKKAYPRRRPFDADAVKGLLANLLPGAVVEDWDGIRVNARSFWVQVRSSNTEPTVRVIIEGESPAEVEAFLPVLERELAARVL